MLRKTKNRKNKMKKYQIYCDRGNGPELDGCWGSEDASFDSLTEAVEASASLATNYPDCDWLVLSTIDGSMLNQIAGTQPEGEE